jgi:hypothetical protein
MSRVKFNNKQEKALEHLGLLGFDWASANDDEFESAYEKVEWSMLSEGRVGDDLNDYGSTCESILNDLADV